MSVCQALPTASHAQKLLDAVAQTNQTVEQRAQVCGGPGKKGRQHMCVCVCSRAGVGVVPLQWAMRQGWSGSAALGLRNSFAVKGYVWVRSSFVMKGFMWVHSSFDVRGYVWVCSSFVLKGYEGLRVGAQQLCRLVVNFVCKSCARNGHSVVVVGDPLSH